MTDRVFKFQQSQGLWFTSDTHFGHSNILTYSKRPFQTLDEHDEALIQNWNAVIKPEHVVFHLGNVSLAGVTKMNSILQRLNGHKYFIFGNHDIGCVKILNQYGEISVKEMMFIRVRANEESVPMNYMDFYITLTHFPLLDWYNSHRGGFSWNLHGHSRGELSKDLGQYRQDVGTDVWQYRPVSFTELLNEMKTRTWRNGSEDINLNPGDQHGDL